jgi:hypothetical protein
MDRNPLPPAPTLDPAVEPQLSRLQGKLNRALIETVAASLTGGLQDLLQTQEELAVTLAALPELQGSPVVEIVVKAQAVIGELLSVVETLRQGNAESLEPETTIPHP